MTDYRKIDINLYTYGSKDIDMWLRRYVRAVNNMLADDANDATKTAAYLKYIGTKLDDFALQIYESSTHQDNWAELRKELVAKLSDPSKAQNFKDKIDFIKWDGEIPLHAYEMQILTTTSTLDPELKANDSLFQRETYKRFLAGLPSDYQTYVEMGMPMRSNDIKMARERAEKYQDILKKNLGSNPLAFWAPPAAATQPSDNFSAFKENVAMQSLTDQISLLSLAQKEHLEIQKETNKNITSLIEHLANTSHTSQRTHHPRVHQYDNQRSYGSQYGHQQNNHRRTYEQFGDRNGFEGRNQMNGEQENACGNAGRPNGRDLGPRNNCEWRQDSHKEDF